MTYLLTILVPIPNINFFSFIIFQAIELFITEIE